MDVRQCLRVCGIQIVDVEVMLMGCVDLDDMLV